MKFLKSFFRKMNAIMFVVSGLLALAFPKIVILMAVVMALSFFSFFAIGDPYAEDRKTGS